MPQITLPDGSIKKFDPPVSVQNIAESIGSGLAKAAIAGKVNDQLVDSSYLIEHDAKVRIITSKDSEGLEIIRHSTAHLLAYAVQSLFPEAEATIGPVIENGFYYDFAYHGSFTPKDLEIIEEKMHELVQKNYSVKYCNMGRHEAIQFFLDKGKKYKVEIINSIPENEIIRFYQMGSFIDLCRGPHVPNTSYLTAFKLMNVSGAYWRGDSNNAMLQRIYGTAWASNNDLKEYLFKLEQAEKRDHRKLGKELDLFHIQEESPGMIFWHTKGWIIWQQIEQYLRRELNLSGYQEVKTPIVMDRSLWEKSGHWDNYRDNMFITESEKRIYAIKPMSCPAHVEIFKKKIHSYRDLPLKLAEFGHCHRNEPSGALHGLMRVRGFTQDDGHIFCTENQIESEVIQFNQILTKAYYVFGFTHIEVKLSLRPEKRAGNDSLWDKAEQGLRNALAACEVKWEELKDEGAFYGPKVEYHIKDSLGRSWQCGTIQLDFVVPARLGAEYVTENNNKATPVMLHRAILGSFERFIAILIEHYAGLFPLWLTPIQVAICNITENQADYCCKLHEIFKKNGLRTILDTRNEKIGFKIREHHLQKIPYNVIIGDKEKKSGTISVRHKTENLNTLDVHDFINKLQTEIKNLH